MDQDLHDLFKTYCWFFKKSFDMHIHFYFWLLVNQFDYHWLDGVWHSRFSDQWVCVINAADLKFQERKKVKQNMIHDKDLTMSESMLVLHCFWRTKNKWICWFCGPRWIQDVILCFFLNWRGFALFFDCSHGCSLAPQGNSFVEAHTRKDWLQRATSCLDIRSCCLARLFMKNKSATLVSWREFMHSRTLT